MALVDTRRLSTVVSVIPHVGQLLVLIIGAGVAIREAVQNLEAALEAEKKLGEEADYILECISLYGPKLCTCNPIHLKKLERVIEELKTFAEEAKDFMYGSPYTRERHRRKYGDTFTKFLECVVKPSDVWNHQKQLEEAKEKFTKELAFIRELGGFNEDRYLPPYDDVKEDVGEKMGSSANLIKWVKVKELEKDILARPVPVHRPEDTEDPEPWYIARVSFCDGYQPGKYSPREGAYFGYRLEALCADVSKVDVLIAEPGSVRWKRMSGEFTHDHFREYKPVEGCRENNGERRVIARALAREHMKIGFLTDKTIQPGKAGPGLECAYVIAGKEEKKIKEYEVLVYASSSAE